MEIAAHNIVKHEKFILNFYIIPIIHRMPQPHFAAVRRTKLRNQAKVACGTGAERTTIKMDFATIFHCFSSLCGEMNAFICFRDDCSGEGKTWRREPSLSDYEFVRYDAKLEKNVCKRENITLIFAAPELWRAEPSAEMAT